MTTPTMPDTAAALLALAEHGTACKSVPVDAVRIAELAEVRLPEAVWDAQTGWGPKQ